MPLKVIGLSKRYESEVIKQFTYQFEPGRLYVIKGVSGCGKTSLLNILGGLDSHYDGEVSLDGEMDRDRLAAAVGYIFQQSLLISDLTVGDNLLLINNDVEKIHAVMKRLGVSHLYDRYPMELSGGERQRIAVVRALISDVKVLLADEPTASLDKTNSMEISLLLSELCEEGCTVIVATHEHYFDDLADEVIYLDYGRISRVQIKETDDTSASCMLWEQSYDSRSEIQSGKRKKEKVKKDENRTLIRILVFRCLKRWKVLSLFPAMILVLLILLFSTVSNRIDAILLGYLEHYYPSDLFQVNDEILGVLDQNVLDEMTVYYPYSMEEDGVKAFYYAEKEDSVLAIDGMLMYGHFPEKEEEIIVSYEFAEEKFGPINTEGDIIGRSYTFANQEFVIAGCMNAFDQEINVGFFFTVDTLFDNDQIYTRNREPMIFIDYKVIQKLGEITETRYDMYMASYDGVMRNKEIISQLHGGYTNQYSINAIESTIKNTEYGMEMFVLILYGILVVCFLIVCIFIRSKVEIELFYRSREIGFLQVFKMGKKKIKKMILWEYVLQLVVAIVVPVGVYVVLMVVMSLYLNAWMVFDPVHIVTVLGLLLLLYVQTLLGAIKKCLKRDVVDLIRA